jgi:hypothetical protein
MYSSVITNTCVWVDVWKWERTQGWSKKLGWTANSSFALYLL